MPEVESWRELPSNEIELTMGGYGARIEQSPPEIVGRRRADLHRQTWTMMLAGTRLVDNARMGKEFLTKQSRPRAPGGELD